MGKNIVVKQVEEAEVTAEVLATEIVAISEGIRRLRAGRLNEDALILLIQHAAPTVKRPGRYVKSPPSAKAIKSVLDGLASLEAAYVRKP